jgi:hypothetical protein
MRRPSMRGCGSPPSGGRAGDRKTEAIVIGMLEHVAHDGDSRAPRGDTIGSAGALRGPPARVFPCQRTRSRFGLQPIERREMRLDVLEPGVPRRSRGRRVRGRRSPGRTAGSAARSRALSAPAARARRGATPPAAPTLAGSSFRRRAHSSASTFVGSATTSVPRRAETTRRWLVGAMREQTPSGASGESSSASKPVAAWKSTAVDREHPARIDCGRLGESIVCPLRAQGPWVRGAPRDDPRSPAGASRPRTPAALQASAANASRRCRWCSRNGRCPSQARRSGDDDAAARSL